MPDFRVAESAAEHPKLRAVGLAAAGLWSLAGAFAMRELTDGWVPAYWVQTWPSGKRHAAALVRVGLWKEEKRNDLPGYQFHDWDDYQRSAARVHRERAEARERMARNRAGSQKTNGSSRVRPNNSRTFERTDSPPGAGPESSDERTSTKPGPVLNELDPANRSSRPVAADASPPETSERSAERSANVHDSLSLSLSLTPSALVGGGTSSTERVAPRNAPRPRCNTHQNWPADQPVPACGACADTRRAIEQRTADGVLAELAIRSAWRAQVDACTECDENGKLERADGTMVRHHDPVSAAS